jgi:hypothetical protein
MISPRTFILAVLILLIAPILSAPINLHIRDSSPIHVHPIPSNLRRDFPMLAVNARRNPSPASESSLVARSFTEEPETNLPHEPAKKTRHENKKLISRSFFSKITNAVKVSDLRRQCSTSSKNYSRKSVLLWQRGFQRQPLVSRMP